MNLPVTAIAPIQSTNSQSDEYATVISATAGVAPTIASSADRRTRPLAVASLPGATPDLDGSAIGRSAAINPGTAAMPAASRPPASSRPDTDGLTERAVPMSAAPIAHVALATRAMRWSSAPSIRFSRAAASGSIVSGSSSPYAATASGAQSSLSGWSRNGEAVASASGRPRSTTSPPARPVPSHQAIANSTPIPNTTRRIESRTLSRPSSEIDADTLEVSTFQAARSADRTAHSCRNGALTRAISSSAPMATGVGTGGTTIGSKAGTSPVSGSGVASLSCWTYSGMRMSTRSLSITATMPGSTPYAAAGPAGSTDATTTWPFETMRDIPVSAFARIGVRTPIETAMSPRTMTARSIHRREMPMARTVAEGLVGMGQGNPGTAVRRATAAVGGPRAPR